MRNEGMREATGPTGKLPHNRIADDREPQRERPKTGRRGDKRRRREEREREGGAKPQTGNARGRGKRAEREDREAGKQ